jgi:AcrR family transcriptional regulator
MATTKPAARRRMRAPERRAQLLDVARQAFGRNGFHNVSMDEVAKEAGVTKPILYDHFSSKQDLYVALIENDAATLERRVKAALDAPTNNRERIRAAYRAYYDFVDEHAEGFTLVMQETLSPATFATGVGEVRERILEAVAQLIMRESRDMTEEEAGTVALGLVSMVEAGAQRDPGGPPEERKRQVDTLVRLAWRGISAVPRVGATE